MPLFSEHISSMYYGGSSPSYTSPSYGYKSSYVPLGSSYSASYLSPGGSYSNHSSLSSYSRSPLTSRWVPGMSRSYSPMLTPISERGATGPLRISSPRRIPIAKRCYGTPSYIQRPININTESIDVSRDRYRPKAPEPSYVPVSKPPNDNSVKDKENGPFMPRVDGKPETGIDSSPGMQRSTIKRGRTVVRLHTIKRKDKDSPRKPVDITQDSEINKKNFPESTIDDDVLEEPKSTPESLSWREKLSDDLVYVDKKEKKSLGTKLVEKFIVKDSNVKNKSERRNSEGTFKNELEKPFPSFQEPSTSKSSDRRCSLELLAEQSILLDSLIRGENLSTAPLDLSKVGLAESTNKLVSSDSIKRRKTDDKGNPLKTTKSDHSLHENLSKSLRGNKDPKVFTKRRSLKKSHSGGSICRLDSITEFPKESVQINLPAIQENKYSPREQKMEQKPKLRTKITGSVEVSPPTSPLKFIIENVTVEEKLHKPKKEISFSYEVHETPVEDVILEVPKSTLRRTKERNSIKKKSNKTLSSDPISPEPDEGNFWAKIGKRETVYLMKRKQNLEAAREENKKSHFWFQEDDEPVDGHKSSIANVDIVGYSNLTTSSNITRDPRPNTILPEVKEDTVKDVQSNKVTVNLEIGKSSDNMQNVSPDKQNTSLKEKKTQAVVDSKENALLPKNNKNNESQAAESKKTKEDIKYFSEENKRTDTVSITNKNSVSEKFTIINDIKTNSELSKTLPLEINKAIAPDKKLQSFDTASSLNKDLKQAAKQNETQKSETKDDLNQSTEIENPKKMVPGNTVVKVKSQAAEVNEKSIKKEMNYKTDSIKIVQSIKPDSSDITMSPEILENPKIKPEDKSNEKDKKPTNNIIVNKMSTPNSQSADISPVEKKKEDIPVLTNLSQTKTEHKDLVKNSKEEIPGVTNLSRTKNENKDPLKDSKEIPGLRNLSQTKNELKGPVKDSKEEITGLTNLSQTKNEHKDPLKDSMTTSEECKAIETITGFGLNIKTPAVLESKFRDIGSPSKVKSINKSLKEDSKTTEPQKSDTGECSESNANINLSTAMKATTIIDAETLQVLIKKESKSIDKDSVLKSNKVENAKDICNTKLPTQPIAELKEQVSSVSTSEIQANNKVEEKKAEGLTKCKQVKAVNEVDSNIDKKIDDSTNKNVTTEATTPSSKKKVRKVRVKSSDKKNGLKSESTDSTPKDICETCKKPLASDDKTTKSSNPITPKPLQEKDRAVDSAVSKAMNSLQKSKSDLNTSIVSNSSDSNLKPETCTSTSQVPIVIETKNIPNEAVASETEQKEILAMSQERLGEENKAEKDSKVKRSSVKKVIKKPVKQEIPVKPLIATPRPLLKRAPQVIHSDTSDSSSEEESSEEEESEASENSETGEFYECDNNPDGRTSTGSNDSGFDSSAPTSPASFLQIRKGGDSPAPGPSSSNASSQLPDTEVGDSELELEASTAYGIFRKTGKFTPPARSIPRFRKYNIEDFQFIKVLGKGSFGKVLLAELRDTEYYYAVKCLKKDVVLEDDDVECTLIERKVLALGTNHPYLCHLFATFQTDSHLFFVMEYLNGGDLMFHIQQSGRFPEPRARFYAAEIVSGLKFLHKRGIVYRDLKLDNILLDFDGHVRIADFGMCKLQIYLDKTADTFCGTPDYMAPEIIKGLKYNQTVDWWSFGVLLYEMLIGQSPFSGCDEDELFWSICNEMPSYPRFLSKEGLTILTRLLDKDAKTRLGGTECMHGDVREQDFFHPVHWDKLERRELETPFKPRVRHPLDTQYFDRAFTGERPRLTAVEPHVLRSMDQEPFRGFSYTNPNATDR